MQKSGHSRGTVRFFLVRVAAKKCTARWNGWILLVVVAACCCLFLNMVFGMFFRLLKLEVLRGIAQCDRSVDVRDFNVSDHGEKEK